MKRSLISFALLFSFISPLFSQKSAEKIYRQYSDAVVRIFAANSLNETPYSQGSGVIIKKKRWIVTNYHLTSGKGAFLYAEHKGKFIKLDSVWAIDRKKDIMILAFSSPDSMAQYNWVPDIKIGNSDKLRVGQKIYAIGSPFGFENTMTDGIVSGLRSSTDTGQSFIQISAPVSPGSSGGAILNDKGELIALSSMVFTDKGAQNINFAVPVNTVMKVAQSYRKFTGLSPDEYVNHYYQIGYSEFYSKQYDTAIVYYKKALPYAKDTTTSAILNYYIGLAFSFLNSYDSASSYYHRSLKEQKIPETYISLGDVYFSQKEYTLAIQNYNAALSLYPASYLACVGLGRAYISEKDYQNALDYLKKAVLIDGTNPLAMYYLGIVALDLDRYDEAITFEKMALELKPDYAEAYIALAAVYDLKEEHIKASECRQKAEQIKNSQSKK